MNLKQFLEFLAGFAVIVIPFLVMWQLGIFSMGGKPAIYLYPEKPMNVNVKVIPTGIFTKTIPEYGGGWSVRATPSGLIDGKYDYLFYETLNLERYGSDKAWTVPADRLNQWFDEYLPRFGLIPKESDEMRDYWVANLRKDGYYRIYPLDEGQLRHFSRLEIEPKPDTLIRVILRFEHIDSPTASDEPVINAVQRKGFTVVEWGGVKTI